ncbi:putative teichuronic acid biosynthesis glycosyltransferase TuaC [Sphingomonas sp. EC-HK361]|uniref:glycosyltransferase n=1 Tax=Sphingomonas sp. EC-HK361 TaxID=2038397 RepID=UPI00125C157F|nr:glycosyltransferase [Sphingomonas sp. EC-HK361]VVS99437.1 putative teichuronic acid biosynthesis glycosyltransferase TuaC [Sphingomonas sp. EC-HK361]
MLRVLTLSTLFPDATRPNFGVFVERQTLGLAAHPDVALRVVAPIGLPPWPLTRLDRFRALAELPHAEAWKGLSVHRPRFTAMPLTHGRRFVPALNRALIPLLDRLRDEAPFDVIDASFFFPDGPAAVAMRRRYGVPVSIKARGADIHHWGHAPSTARQVRDAGRAAEGLLAVSETMRADMAAIGIPAERVRVHRTGVDLARFAPCDRLAGKAALGVDGPLVVSVGALIPRKGHEIVIRAIAGLPGATLLIAGDGPERGNLESLIAALGIGDRVHLLGSVAHCHLPPLLAAADVMALASSSEGLANAWVEALASGTPVVISDAGGARELVTGDDAGRIVARTPHAFAAGIAAMLAAAPPADAVRRFAQDYTWEANAEALYTHLLGLVEAHRNQSSSPRRRGSMPLSGGILG